jgi:hypothetical protein
MELALYFSHYRQRTGEWQMLPLTICHNQRAISVEKKEIDFTVQESFDSAASCT